MKPTLLFYCQHSTGMGHFVRSVTLAKALAQTFDVHLLAGGALPRGFRAPTGVRVVALPPVGTDAAGALVSRDGRRTLARAMDVRARLLGDLGRRAAPAVVVVELYPFGRRKFRREVEALLEGSCAVAAPLVICSVRDILVGREDGQAAHDAAAVDALRAFDGVIVHGDPWFARIEDSLTPGLRLPVPVEYSGFVHETPAVREADRREGIVVSAGGGQVGAPLFDAAVDAYARLTGSGRPAMTVVTGPFCPEDVRGRLRQRARALPGLTIRDAVDGLTGLFARAAGSISQCGYNTSLDLLASRVPALVVPYGDGSESEQRTRARRLAEAGAVCVLPARELSADALAAAIPSLLHFKPARVPLSIGGAVTTRRLIEARLGLSPNGAAQHELELAR